MREDGGLICGNLCNLWIIVLCIWACGCATGRQWESGVGGSDEPVEPQPYVETVPGSTVTFAMRPVRIVPESGGPAHYVWFAETETTWDAYDVFWLRLDENAGNVAAAGGAPDAITSA